MQNNNEDFIVISNNILKRRLTLLIGLIFMSIVHTVFFIISYVIRGNENIYLFLDGLLCLSLWGYLIFYIVKGKYEMFESLYRIGRIIYSLPILYYAVITIIHGVKYRALNYEYLAYMILAIALELFIFRFNLKDPNPLKKNNKSLVLSIIAMVMVPVFLLVGYFSNADISILDFSRTLKYELNEEGSLSITGVYNGLSKSVRIPETFYTQSVTRINDNAFYNVNIESIYISKSITNIGSNAFYNVEDVYLEGNPYLERKSLYGVSVLHILNDKNVLECDSDFFDGDYIDVDRKLIDQYRTSIRYKKYDIHPSVNSDEVFVNFNDLGIGYINTCILKKGQVLSIDTLKKTGDLDKYLFSKTSEYQATDEYYKEIYEYDLDRIVIPYWLDENGKQILFNQAVNESMTIKPKMEEVISASIDYKLDPSLNEVVYVSESRSFELPTIDNFNREGFDSLTYSSEGNVITKVTSRLKDKAEVIASWNLEAPSINDINGLTNFSLSREYAIDEYTNLEAKVSHTLPVEYVYTWKKGATVVSTSKDYDIHTVKQSGNYQVSVVAKYQDYGVDYVSNPMVVSFIVDISKATPILTASEVNTVYDKKNHGVTDAKITYGEETLIKYSYSGSTYSDLEYNSTIAPVEAGIYTALVSIKETDNFKAGSIFVPVTIQKRNVSVSLYDNMNHTYNGKGEAEVDTRYTSNELKTVQGEAGNEGLIAGDNLSPTLYGLTLTNDRIYAGEYEINLVIDNPNYKINYTPVTYHVYKRDATIEEISTTTIYGEEVEIYSPTITNISADDLSLIKLDIYEDDTLTNIAKKDNIYSYYNSGTYYIGYEENDLLNANYNITHIAGTIEVLKREILVTPSMDELIYNGELQIYNVELSNAAEKHKMSSIASISGNIEVDAGTYTFEVSIDDAYKDNYELGTFDNTFTIAKRKIELYYTPLNKTYGDDMTLEYQVVDHGENETLLDKDKEKLVLGLYIKDTTTSVSKDYYGYYPANVYEIYHIANESLDKNYEIKDSKTQVSISRRKITFSLKDSELIYNGFEQVAPYTVFNEALGQKDLVLNVAGIKNKNAGSYVVTVEVKDEFKNNYGIEIANYSYSILKADLVIKAKDQTIYYGDQVIPDYTALGFVGNDNISSLSGTLSYSYSYNQYDPVGDYEIEASGLSSSNYNISYAKGYISVLPKELIGEITCNNITYGESFNPTVNYSGFVRSIDEASLTEEIQILNLDDEAVSGILHVGTYNINVIADLENYSISIPTLTVKVLPKELNISLSNATISLGETLDLQALLEVNGLVSSDTVDIEVSILDNGLDTSILDSGTYTLIITTNEYLDYVIDTTITAELTVL